MNSNFKSFSDTEISNLIETSKPYQGKSILINGTKYWYIKDNIQEIEHISLDGQKTIKRTVYGQLNSSPNERIDLILDELIKLYKQQPVG